MPKDHEERKSLDHNISTRHTHSLTDTSAAEVQHQPVVGASSEREQPGGRPFPRQLLRGLLAGRPEEAHRLLAQAIFGLRALVGEPRLAGSSRAELAGLPLPHRAVRARRPARLSCPRAGRMQ